MPSHAASSSFPSPACGRGCPNEVRAGEGLALGVKRPLPPLARAPSPPPLPTRRGGGAGRGGGAPPPAPKRGGGKRGGARRAPPPPHLSPVIVRGRGIGGVRDARRRSASGRAGHTCADRGGAEGRQARPLHRDGPAGGGEIRQGVRGEILRHRGAGGALRRRT